MKEKENNPIGYLFTVSAYVMWGGLAIYWKMLKEVTAIEVQFHRVLWSSIILLVVVFLKYKSYLFDLIKDKIRWKYLLFSSVLIGINWYVFIYAISINRILDASLGYYINPLISIILGVIFLKEKLSVIQFFAVFLAVIGVIYITVDYGKLPIISLVLAISFGLYGLVKKLMAIEAIPSVLIESVLLLPIFYGLFYFSIKDPANIAFFSKSLKIDFLLIFSGVVTFIPLFLFGKGTSMIPLKSVGFIQYIAPTMMLLIGVLIYNEPFNITQLISFSLIWFALGLYSWSILKARNVKKKTKGEFNAETI